MTEVEALATGRDALAAGRWEEARAAFAAALAERETPEALDGMGVALWWLGETRASVAHTERAYAGFRRASDAVSAAVAAMSLCVTWISNFDNHAAAGGWLARAERLLEDADPNPLQGWLWLMRGYLEPDPGRARVLQQRALELARESDDPDLELSALGDLGLSLVTEGRASEGLALIDEAMAGTLGGERRRLDTVVFACCDMLIACDLAGDLQRAVQWCQVADRFIDRYGCPFLYARCRTLYGGILVAKGRWAEAEQELLAAIRMAEGAGPASHAEALARLADLRLRQGRLEEAEGLLPERGGGRAAARTAARLRLARDEPAVAAGLLERALEDDGQPGIHGEHHLRAAAALETLVAARLALGDADAAGAAAARLAELASGDGGGQVAALAVQASARVAAAGGRADEAGRLLGRALGLLVPLDLPHETALVRLELARALAAENPELAVAEARSALGAFEALGAKGDADAADALLRSLGAPGRTGPKRVGELTRREQEVLRLVGLGLSNPEIAQRLFISRKTAAHHVSNVLAKLGVRNRAG
ncbi:MAG TPA: LuxR C-terminal-related transcriptional regulator, partial [Actinomycetes bacterium]|nr:LuxR C-terminal-related transcriptional regulator [Actinomycetes bacterium]